MAAWALLPPCLFVNEVAALTSFSFSPLPFFPGCCYVGQKGLGGCNTRTAISYQATLFLFSSLSRPQPFFLFFGQVSSTKQTYCPRQKQCCVLCVPVPIGLGFFWSYHHRELAFLFLKSRRTNNPYLRFGSGDILLFRPLLSSVSVGLGVRGATTKHRSSVPFRISPRA